MNKYPVIHDLNTNLSNHNSSNYSLVIDDCGILYLGQENKISAYNGSFWYFITVKGKIFLCRNENNEIYFSGEKMLGYLSSDSLNRLVPVSLNEKLPPGYVNFNKVRVLANLKNDIFFQIDSSLLVYRNGEFEVVAEDTDDAVFFKTGRGLIKSEPDGKLVIYSEENKIEKFNTGIRNTRLIIPADDDFFIFDADNYIYKANSDFRITYTKHLGFIQDVISGIYLANKTLLVSDSQNSLFNIDQNGFLTFRWNDLPEIAESRILGLIDEQDHGIWLLQEATLLFMEYPYIIDRVFSMSKGSGIIRDIKSTDNDLYISTTKGLFRQNLLTGITDLLFNDKCRGLTLVDSDLCFIAKDKLYLVSEKGPAIIYQGQILDISYDRKSESLFLSSNSGITILKINHHKVISSGFYKTSIIPQKILCLDNQIWYTDFGNLYNSQLYNNESFTERKINLPGNAGIDDFYVWQNKLKLIISGKHYKVSEDTVQADFEIPLNLTYPKIQAFGNEFGSILILSSNIFRGCMILSYEKNRSEILKSVILPSYLDLTFPSFDYVKSSILLISSGSDIYTLDLNAYLSDKYDSRVNITGIYTRSDTIFEGFSGRFFNHQFIDKKLMDIPYRERSMKIRLSSLNFFQENPQYQYSFDMDIRKWSEWSNDPVISLSDLSHGNHKLEIRSKNNNGNPGPSINLTFSIAPPFHKSLSAFAVYLLLTAILLFIIFKSYRYSLHKNHRTIVSAEDDIVFYGLPTESQHDISGKINPTAGTETDRGKDHARWDKYDMVTVLFSDIQGFTKIAESTNPEVLIDELDRFFFHFDSVVEKYNIEKIKTIGDAYMAAGGIPEKNSCNPVEVVLAALEMQLYMKQLKNTKVDIWDLRIGIHTGPVIAGEVGHKKRSYDIWGDTVNTASRMESSGEPGKVNISGISYSYVKDFFICEYRGKLPVKYKGNIDMYFVKGLRPELSINLAGMPNRRLYLKLQMLRLRDLEEFVFSKLEADLPKNMYFHNLEYIKHLYEYAHLITKAENLDEEETLLILSTTLLMNLGYTVSYANQEHKSAEYARSLLKNYRYSEKQIAIISNLILATKRSAEPQTSYEKLLYDIKMEYLGRADLIRSFKLLYLEQNEHLMPLSMDDFKKQQIRILENHRFYSKSAVLLQEVPKEDQIKKVLEEEWQ